MSRSDVTALLNVSTVFCKSVPLTVLWDSGSDISLITHDMAKKLELKGKDVNLSMIKAGSITEHHSSKEYCLPLIDKFRNLYEISVIGIKEVSANVDRVNVSKIRELFADVKGHTNYQEM